MRYSYEEARKEMDFYVEKMKLASPEEAYRIQCVWESMLHGYGDGKEEGYEDGYDDGYEDAKAEYSRWSDE